MNKINCPVCASSLKKAGHTVFCDCGWHKSLNKKEQMGVQKKIAKGLVIAGISLMGAVVYVGNWGSSSLSIIPLKAQQWTGQMNEKSFARMKSVCLQLKKYGCVEQAHRSYFRSSGDLQALEELGEFQYRRKKFTQAGKTYAQYFSQKGQGVKPAYNYARVLEKAGQTDHALSYYEYALKSRAGVVQITVMRSYLNLLVKSGQVSKAKAELLKFKPLLKTAGSLVQQEYERWMQQVI